ncbi:MAG: TlpA disulfide reductase family protein [Balneolaceae bacterium]
MRLDSKYFTPFLAVTTVVTMAVILYATISYLNRQQEIVRENVADLQTTQLVFERLEQEGELSASEFTGQPLVVHFWATWSGRSEAVGDQLEEIRQSHPELVVIAASVRDHPDLAVEWARSNQESFYWVEGTRLYQDLQIPGVPSQLLINRRGEVATLHVGDDAESLNRELERLIGDE